MLWPSIFSSVSTRPKCNLLPFQASLPADLPLLLGVLPTVLLPRLEAEARAALLLRRLRGDGGRPRAQDGHHARPQLEPAVLPRPRPLPPLPLQVRRQTGVN